MASFGFSIGLVVLIVNTVTLSYCEDNSNSNNANCPSPDIIKPCICNQATKTIRCFSTTEFDIEQVFKTISQAQRDSDGPWNTLELNLNSLTELKDSMFQGVTFRTIKLLHCSKLQCINPTAFQGMERIIENFIAYDTSFAADEKSSCNIFSALKKLKNLRSVNITQSKIREIPAKAFYELGTSFNQLTHVDFSGNQGGEIARIGRYAFASLKALKYVDLSQHQISRIDSQAFYIEDPSNEYLTINLEQNQLTGESFDVDSFAINGRITTIKLAGNGGLQALKESVWRAFLLNTGRTNPTDQNIIDLRGSPISCNKQNLWILENKYKLHRRLLHITSAESGIEFWKHTPAQCDK